MLSGFSDTKVSPRRPRAFVSKSLNLHLPRILPACCPHHRILTGAPANGPPSIHLAPHPQRRLPEPHAPCSAPLSLQEPASLSEQVST